MLNDVKTAANKFGSQKDVNPHSETLQGTELTKNEIICKYIL